MTLKNLDLKQFQEFAGTLGKKYGTKAVTIGLVGPLGAGKTTFTQAFARALGIKKVTSPSFVVAHEYRIRDRKFYHIDFYRLTRLKQTVDLGLDEILTGDNLVLIEWADRFPEILKQCNVQIQIKINTDKTRHVLIQNHKN